jgi:predicted DNA-binding protein with PD1-like motif
VRPTTSTAAGTRSRRTGTEPLQTWVLPGVDPIESLLDACKDNGWTAAFVVCAVGSLQNARLRFAARAQPDDIAGPLELISLSGTLSLDGPHLHATVSDAQGHVHSGHLRLGSRVRTMAEILVAVLPDVIFRRRPDPRTGHAVLVVEARPAPN